MQALLRPRRPRDEAIAGACPHPSHHQRPVHFDEVTARKRAEEAYDRCFNPAGVARQLLGILASGSRAEGLARSISPRS